MPYATHGELNIPTPARRPHEEPYWEALQRRELLLQSCTECGAKQFYPRLICRHCQSEDLDWVSSQGTGTVYSYSVVTRSPKAFEDIAPYTLAVVELDEGARIPTRLVGMRSLDPYIGARARAKFVELSEGYVWPLFEITNE